MTKDLVSFRCIPGNDKNKNEDLSAELGLNFTNLSDC